MSGRHSSPFVASGRTVRAVLGELEVVETGQLLREVGRDRDALIGGSLCDEASEGAWGSCDEALALDSGIGHDSSSRAICAKTTRM